MNCVGIDIVENKRIKNSSKDFIEQILTKKELIIYHSKIGSKKLEYLCGRFAAKEAIIKCVSEFENPHMLEIEILNNNIGKPLVYYKGYKISLSIAHEKNYTVAIAMANNDDIKKNSV